MNFSPRISKRSLVVDERSPIFPIHAAIIHLVKDLWTIGRHSVILTDAVIDAMSYAFLFTLDFRGRGLSVTIEDGRHLHVCVWMLSQMNKWYCDIRHVNLHSTVLQLRT